jgi:hypothetical protein
MAGRSRRLDHSGARHYLHRARDAFLAQLDNLYPKVLGEELTAVAGAANDRAMDALVTAEVIPDNDAGRFYTYGRPPSHLLPADFDYSRARLDPLALEFESASVLHYEWSSPLWGVS